MTDEDVTGFGLARIKREGAPIHPDDVDWEHPPGSGCLRCQAKYDRQLKAWQDDDKLQTRGT